MTVLDRIRAVRRQRATKAAEIAALDEELAVLIRQALEEGHGPTELAKVVGVTRARVYQIKKGTR